MTAALVPVAPDVKTWLSCRPPAAVTIDMFSAPHAEIHKDEHKVCKNAAAGEVV